MSRLYNIVAALATFMVGVVVTIMVILLQVGDLQQLCKEKYDVHRCELKKEIYEPVRKLRFD